MRFRPAAAAAIALVALLLVVVMLLREPSQESAARDGAARARQNHALPEPDDSVDSHPAPQGFAASTPGAQDLPQPIVAAPIASATVTGRVIDSHQRPVAGARVSLGVAPTEAVTILEAIRAYTGPHDWAVSSIDGRFRVEQAADGLQELLLAAKGGQPRPAAHVCVVPGVAVDVGDVVLPEASTITGRVEDENGQPAAEAEVLVTDVPNLMRALLAQPTSAMQLACWGENVGDEEWIQSIVRNMDWSARTRSGSDGRFEVQAWSSAESLFAVARKPGCSLAVHSTDISYGSTDDGTLTELPVLVLCHAPERIAGRVVAADGSPPGVEVVVTATSQATDPPHPALGRAVHAAPDGSFVVDGLVAGPQDLEASTADRRDSATVRARGGATDVRLVLCERPRVVVHVTRDGTPAAAFELWIAHRSPFTHGFDEPATWERRAVGASAHGTVVLDDLPLDDITLQAFADGACSWPEPANPFRNKLSVDVTLDLRPAATLRGVVIDRESQAPLADAILRASCREFGGALANDRCVTSGDGQFVLGPLPLEASVARGKPVGIRVTAPGHAPLLLRSPLDTTAPRVVALERRTLVQIRPGAAARAAGFAMVHVTNLDQGGLWVTEPLSPNGLFVDSLAPGRYRALVDGLDVTTDFTAVAGELVVVDL